MRKPVTVEEAPQPARERILRAAMETFMERGYAEASTLLIATRARVSKRELYSLFGSKQAMLAACVSNRVARTRLPTPLSPPRTHEELASTLFELGLSVLREISIPAVVAVFRLAIMEAQRAPEVATTLEASRRSVRAALFDILVGAQAEGLINAGDTSDMGDRFLALLWGDLMLGMLLRVREEADIAEIERRAKSAAVDFLKLYS